MSPKELKKLIEQIQKKMKKAAADLDFETAAALRDQMIELKIAADMRSKKCLKREENL